MTFLPDLKGWKRVKGSEYSYYNIGRENNQKRWSGRSFTQAGRSGFTLVELLVYIAIMGFIVIVAGRAFSDSTGMRIRSQNMIASAEEAGRVSAILKEDISQMGTKSWGRSSASAVGSNIAFAFDTIASVHYNFNNGNLNSPSTDLSSYVLVRNNPADFDSLYFSKAHYDIAGVCGAVMEVEWYVTADSALMRKCSYSTPAKCNGDFDASACPDFVEMARNVAEFRFLPSKPGTEGATGTLDTLFPASSASSFGFITNNTTTSGMASAAGTKVTLSGFAPNPSASSGYVANFYLAEPGESDCFRFPFHAGEEYAIDFDLPCINYACKGTNIDEKYNPMVMFQPGRDHLSVGLRNPNMNGDPIDGVPDFLFYPPQDEKANRARHFEFSIPPPGVTACVGITAAFYSPAAAGRLEIEKFKVYRKTDNVYYFDRSSGSTGYNPSVNSDKASVKAFELTLGINKKGEINRIATVIPVPNNGIVSGGY